MVGTALRAFAHPTDSDRIRGESPLPAKSGAREKVGYAVLSNSSRPISMRRISLVPAPIS
ncbi:hypothetical protein ACVJGD_003787 [Bradyrhizobium sp. USDA 10063]